MKADNENESVKNVKLLQRLLQVNTRRVRLSNTDLNADLDTDVMQSLALL